MDQSTATPDELFAEFPLEWEMSLAERLSLIGLLTIWRPDTAVEIGTHFGGSLQVLAAHCGRVYSIDMDPRVRVELAPRFPRADFRVGSSRDILPQVLAEISRQAEKLEFVLVDGDHTAAGVQADIDALLSYRPNTVLHVLLHDSFNPDCRTGMRRAAWADCPYVHKIELDFIPGTFHTTAQGGAFAGSMWGGFAHAVFRPEPRIKPLVLGAAQEKLHQMVFRQSTHRLWHKASRFFGSRWGTR